MRARTGRLLMPSIKSRRRSSGGDGRHFQPRSDQLADTDTGSQPAAGPRTNPTGRTSPPGVLTMTVSGHGYCSKPTALRASAGSAYISIRTSFPSRSV